MKLEDGRILPLSVTEAMALNCAMQKGDEGELVNLPNGKTKFKIFADDVLPFPQPPDIIPTPTENLDNA